MGGLYHEQRVEWGSDVCPNWCTSKAYSLCEVPLASEKAEELPWLYIVVMMFCQLIGFLFIYFKNCQSCALSLVCNHNFSGWESGLSIYSTK